MAASSLLLLPAAASYGVMESLGSVVLVLVVDALPLLVLMSGGMGWEGCNISLGVALGTWSLAGAII